MPQATGTRATPGAGAPRAPSAKPTTLEEVLADAREEASLLSRHGHAAQAQSITSLCDAVTAVMRSYLTWLSEDNARLRSGHGTDYLRARFAQWEADGMARKVGRMRQYREVIVPMRQHLSVAREAGRRGERMAG